MTARFSPSEIAAAAREARAGVEVELHKPDGSKIVVRPVTPPQGDDFDRVDFSR